MKKISILILLLCAMHAYSQVKIVNGGNVWIGSAFNPANHTIIGSTSRLFSSKLSLYGYFNTALAIDHTAATTPNPNDPYNPFPINYQLSTIVSVDNFFTKSWIVDFKYKKLGNILHRHEFFVYGYGQAWAFNGFVKFSDSNCKFDVQPISGALSKIQSLNGVYYRLKPSSIGVTIDSTNQDSFQSQRRQIGFIAQQVEPILPEVVFNSGPDSTQTDTTKGIDYTAMVALLVEGMKEQQTQIASLQTQIDTLQSQLNQCCNQQGIMNPNDKKRKTNKAPVKGN